jgi:hypothetical protein
VRLGIENAAPQDVLPHLLVLAQGLEDVRLLLGSPVQVLSGYRCEDLERVLCAKDFAAWCEHRRYARDEVAWCEYFKAKAHPRGYAGDIVVPGFGRPAQVAHVLKASGIAFDQIILEGSWVHVSFDPRLRGQVLTATFNAGTPTYSNGVA